MKLDFDINYDKSSLSLSKLDDTFDYNMVVPLRNTIFLTIASLWATSLNISLIVYGAHTGDNRYPDCRPAFTRSLQEVINLSEVDGINAGIRNKLHIWSPAIDNLSKSELLLIGYEALGEKIFTSWSCYLGTSSYNKGNTSTHRKNIQCGRCESCMNRKQAFSNAGLEDKTQYVNH